MNPTAIIADDEAALAEHLRRRLATLWPELEVLRLAANGIEASEAIAELSPTVAFLDIKMPGRSGLEVAQGIETDTRVVFVTAYDEYALEAFEREAVDYLVKPVDAERLARTVARLKRAIGESTPTPEIAQLLEVLMRGRTSIRDGTRTGPGSVPGAGSGPGGSGVPGGITGNPGAESSATRLKWIRASRGDTTFHVPVQDILYFQADDKYTVVQTTGGEHLIRLPLAELLAGLDPELFWQIHRSSVVNLTHVRGTRRDESGRLFVLFEKSDVQLPVSRAYAHRFRQM